MLAPAPKLLVAALPGVPFYTVISDGRSINFVMYGDVKVEHIFTLVSYGKDRLWTCLSVFGLLIGKLRFEAKPREIRTLLTSGELQRSRKYTS